MPKLSLSVDQILGRVYHIMPCLDMAGYSLLVNISTKELSRSALPTELSWEAFLLGDLVCLGVLIDFNITTLHVLYVLDSFYDAPFASFQY